MKKIIYFLVFWGLILTGCSKDSDDDSMNHLQAFDERVDKFDLKSGVVYEGTWTVNQQVVDTARMETNGLTLPTSSADASTSMRSG